MKTNLKLPTQFAFINLLMIGGLFIFSSTASAALFRFSPNSGELSDSTEIQIVIDTEGESVESAAAVVSFDPTQVEIVELYEGSFFDDISVDNSQSGEVAITGTLNIGDVEGKTGTGTFATMTISPKITSGNIALYFRCSSAEMDDSNILDIEGTDLLATDEQCARNVQGSYTVSTTSGTGTTDTGTTDNAGTTAADTGSEDQDYTDDSTKGDQQPVMPDELPESGPRDWLKWIVSGLAFIGIGLLLF